MEKCQTPALYIAVLKKVSYAHGGLCPMPYALCPMPSSHLSEKGYNLFFKLLHIHHKKDQN